MRVALFSRNARIADAIGQQVQAKLAYFQQLGAEVKVYLSEGEQLRPEIATVSPVIGCAKTIWRMAQDYLLSCDLVIAEFGAAYELMDLLPAIAGRGPRIVVDYRGVTPVELGDAGLRSELEAAARQRMLLWCADMVLVQSEFAATELVEGTGLPRQRIQLIPCWMAPPGEEEAKLAVPLRRQHGLSEARIVLFVGRLASNKQPGMLVEALAQLPGDVHGVFVGCQQDAYREQLQQCRQRAEELQVDGRVHFPGTVDEAELAGWYRTAEVLVLPSRHECFGMPVVEAMLRGTPCVTSDAGSLAEVIGHAGLSADVDDVNELARQIARMLAQPAVPARKSVALVTHRFGTHFAGGAEKSLRLMAGALQKRGYAVEVFTTCNEHESQWSNALPAGTREDHGFVTHRFPIDAVDSERLGQAYEAIRHADGRVSDELQQQYLQNSLGSRALVSALVQRQNEFAAIITGPYLFRLVHDVVKQFGEQVLLAPCFHDEPLAKLPILRRTYRQAGGLLFHTAMEARLAAEQLKISQPRHTVVGTVLEKDAFTADAEAGRSKVGSPYVVYCGRYCPEKGLDRVLQWMEQLHRISATSLKLVCLGQGPMKLPRRPWLVDMGFVSEPVKRDVIAGAIALINLSRNESLSIVALEAWALSVPVVVESGCAVLKDQVERSQAGVCVADAEAFCRIMQDWVKSPHQANRLGELGREFALREYGSLDSFVDRLEHAVTGLQKPLSEIACQQGQQRARKLYSTQAWTVRLSSILEQVQTMSIIDEPSRARIEPFQDRIMIALGTESSSVTLRIRNEGARLLASSGPARVMLKLNISSRGKKISSVTLPMAAPIAPGQEQLVVAAFEVPRATGHFRLTIRLKEGNATLATSIVRLKVTRSGQSIQPTTFKSTGGVVQTARAALAQAKRMEKLPEDYVDVCEGKLAGMKRMLKRKLLNNFRRAYIDVAFRQQSALNEKLIAVMSLMLESVAAQDTGTLLAEMQLRLQRLEQHARKERRMRRRLQRRLRMLTSPVSLLEGNPS